MTHHLDPDRLRPAPPHPGFAPLLPDVDADVCRLCRALVPATEVARARHVEWDAKVVMVATVALTSQLSGSAAGLAPPAAPAGPDPNVPSPPHEVPGIDHPNRDGDEDANPPPDPASPGPGGAQPPRPASTTGKRAAGRGVNDEAAELALFEQARASEGWAR
jgi:hypothetical protein